MCCVCVCVCVAVLLISRLIFFFSFVIFHTICVASIQRHGDITSQQLHCTGLYAMRVRTHTEDDCVGAS